MDAKPFAAASTRPPFNTALPLVNRTAKALSHWLAPTYGGPLELRPDYDAIEALSPEREALWSRLEKATFLTQNEKRAAIGYGPIEEGSNDLSRKYRPDQPRIPAGQTGGGQWTSDGGNDASETNPDNASVVPVAGKLDALRKFGKLTVREFVSRFCRAGINRELPGEFENVPIEDLINIARGGDHRARTCLKLLGRKEYRK